MDPVEAVQAFHSYIRNHNTAHHYDLRSTLGNTLKQAQGMPAGKIQALDKVPDPHVLEDPPVLEDPVWVLVSADPL